MAKKKSGKKAKAKARSKSQTEGVAQHATEDVCPSCYDQPIADEAPAATLASDEDGYLVPPAPEAEAAPAVVVADYAAGGEIAEPTKVLKISNDRRARKAEQRQNLEK